MLKILMWVLVSYRAIYRSNKYHSDTAGNRLNIQRRLNPWTSRVKNTTANVAKIRVWRDGTSNGSASTKAIERAPRKPLQKMTTRQERGTKLHNVAGIRGWVRDGSINTTTRRESNTAIMAMPAVKSSERAAGEARNASGFN